MKLCTVQQMREIDRCAIEDHGIPSRTLMERAGRALADSIFHRYTACRRIGVLLGRGNNAGDGLVAARILADAGLQVELFLTAAPEKFSSDARYFWENGPESLTSHHVDTGKYHDALMSCDCLIDAIFGTGLARDIEGAAKALIDAANAHSTPIIAADIPSGINGDTGQIHGCAIHATETVSFGLAKLGMAIAPGCHHVGMLRVADIGFPEALLAQDTGYSLNTRFCFAPQLPQRSAGDHKGTAGHALIIAGSLGKIGAGYLASRAALRSGAGLATYALPQSAYDRFEPAAAEVMCEALPDEGTAALHPTACAQLDQLFSKAQAIACGPGIGTQVESWPVVQHCIAHVAAPLVLDADALNLIATHGADSLKQRTHDTVLTPHPAEMGRLLEIETASVQAKRAQLAQQFATEHGVWVVLKGERTVIAAPDGHIWINPTGTPALATAGTGDVLTGIIAGLLAQGMPTQAAVCAAVFFHGEAGVFAAATRTPETVIASDIIDALGTFFGQTRTSLIQGAT